MYLAREETKTKKVSLISARYACVRVTCLGRLVFTVLPLPLPCCSNDKSIMHYAWRRRCHSSVSTSASPTTGRFPDEIFC